MRGQQKGGPCAALRLCHGVLSHGTADKDSARFTVMQGPSRGEKESSRLDFPPVVYLISMAARVRVSVAGAKISQSLRAYAGNVPLPFRSKVFRRAGISLKTQYLGINKPLYHFVHLFVPLNITPSRDTAIWRTVVDGIWSMV